MFIKKVLRFVFTKLNNFTNLLSHILLNGLIKIIYSNKFKEISLDKINDEMSRVSHNGYSYNFYTPNKLNVYRANTFSTKEPETLEWIDQFSEHEIMWDIGANIGLYSIYAAKTKKIKVYSFEPSIFNLELLSKNIYINNLSDDITVIPLPLTDQLKLSTLNMSSMQLGGALSTFGETYGYDGKSLSSVFKYSTCGISIDEAVKLLKIPSPDHIKLDVDGIEHLILKGGANTLKNVKSLLIEINDDFLKQVSETAKYLTDAGLILKEKRHALIYEGTTTYNQIWVRAKS
jgi:FkbM family methyltransferase